MPPFSEHIRHMRADESGPSGNNDPHERSSCHQ
jgi:hypothetical protein